MANVALTKNTLGVATAARNVLIKHSYHCCTVYTSQYNNCLDVGIHTDGFSQANKFAYDLNQQIFSI